MSGQFFLELDMLGLAWMTTNIHKQTKCLWGPTGAQHEKNVTIATVSVVWHELCKISKPSVCGAMRPAEGSMTHDKEWSPTPSDSVWDSNQNWPKKKYFIQGIHPKEVQQCKCWCESIKIEPPRNHVWRLMIVAVAPKTCAKSDHNWGIWVHVTIERSNVKSMKVQKVCI